MPPIRTKPKNKLERFIRDEMSRKISSHSHTQVNGEFSNQPKLGIRTTIKITKHLQEQAKTKFKKHKLEPEKRAADNSRLRIDLYDKDNNTAHEFCFGQGGEIFKDILKAFLVDAKELVVFARMYPDKAMPGLKYIENSVKPLLNKLEFKIAIIDCTPKTGPGER